MDIIPFNYLGTDISVEHAVSVFITEKGGSISLRNIYIIPITLRGITIKMIPVELLAFVIDYLYLYMIWPFIRAEKWGEETANRQEAAEPVGIRINSISHISQHVTTMPTCRFQPLAKETLDKDYISLAYNERLRLPLSWHAFPFTFLQ